MSRAGRHSGRAREPFRFVDYEGLVMPTGRRAVNLRELVDQLRSVPTEVLHHHLFRTPLRHRFGVWDYPNDFALWAAHSLEDLALAEKLAALDPYALRDLEEAREILVDLVEDHLEGLPLVPWVRRGFEFHFASGLYLALPGEREVWSLREMRDAVAEVPLSSLYYHFHEARLRVPGDDSDDFSRWISAEFGRPALVERLRRVDFYFYSLADLRERIVEAFEEEIAGGRP